MADPLTPAQLLAALPQREPFRFVDEIVAVDDDRIVATFRFRADADFYRGHFPGRPVTPGVLLLEAMAQAGVAAHGVYLLAREAPGAPWGAARSRSTARSPRIIGPCATRSPSADAPPFRNPAQRWPSETPPCWSMARRSTRCAARVPGCFATSHASERKRRHERGHNGDAPTPPLDDYDARRGTPCRMSA